MGFVDTRSDQFDAYRLGNIFIVQIIADSATISSSNIRSIKKQSLTRYPKASAPKHAYNTGTNGSSYCRDPASFA